jgi:hypothetical protein
LVHRRGYGFPYTAARQFHQGFKENWRSLRAVFALDYGVDPRSWSAADRAAIAFLLLKREYRNDTDSLRELFLLVDDKAAVAAIDRQKMGQPDRVEVGEAP